MSIDSNPSDITTRMLSNISDTGFLDAWFYHLVDKSLRKYCESPIEAVLGAALLFYDKFDGLPGFPPILRGQHEEWPFIADARYLIPQYEFESYRIDWVFMEGSQLTCIECDGHDFHERTKEQASRDKLRDRKIQAAGHPILRFTGSEIHKDALHCAAQIFEFVGNRNVPAEFREHA